MSILKSMDQRFSFQDQVMNIFVMLPALITPLTMAIHQLAESAPLLSKAWIWPPYHLGSAPGMMGRALLNTERWRPKEAPRRTEEAKVRGLQPHSRAARVCRKCPSPPKGPLLCLSLAWAEDSFDT